MMYKTHMASGLVAGQSYLILSDHTFATGSDFALAGACLAVSMFFSTLPDIDQPQSWIGRRIIPISMLLSVLNVKHRTFTHSIVSIALMYFFLVLATRFIPIPEPIFWGVIVGYVSHIFIDMFNKQGVELLYPYSKRIKFPFFNIRTGRDSIGEKIFSLTSSAIAIYLFYLIGVNQLGFETLPNLLTNLL